MFKRHVLFVAGSFDMYSSPVIYQNELFRFGGLNTLRGFNEEELFASVKGLLTVEYRFLLDQSSNVFVFYDQCMYENNALEYFKDEDLEANIFTINILLNDYPNFECTTENLNIISNILMSNLKSLHKQ